MEYLAGKKSIVFYRILYILLVFAGSTMSLALVWNMADIMNALMTVPNLIALLMLSGVIAKDTQYYLWEKNLDEESREDRSEGRGARGKEQGARGEERGKRSKGRGARKKEQGARSKGQEIRE